MAAELPYRPEIDGLRAVAVIPVLLFHAGFDSFQGGYVGVDIFFVISGYLITTIIVSGISNKTFSVVEFYERRTRRILPVLFLILFVSCVFAWKYLLPDELKVFGQGVTAAVLFSANIYLYVKNNDYFGIQAENNPVLHLWSLGAEEQFYLLFPLIMIAIWKWRSSYSVVLLPVLLLSLGYSQWLLYHNPAAAFFLLPSRAWELLIGSILASTALKGIQPNVSRGAAELLCSAGLVLILISIFVFDKQTPFPGLWGLLPTTGAGLLILFSSHQTMVGRFLSHRVIVFIGLLSFSLYLWHQPLFSFYRFFSSGKTTSFGFACLILLCFILSYLSWKYVEKPFRDRSRFSRFTIFSLAVGITGLFVVFGLVAHLNSGYPQRNPVFKRLASNYGLSLSCNGNSTIRPLCSTSDAPEVAIFGNSYAMHLVEGYVHSHPGTGVVQLTRDSCHPHSRPGPNNKKAKGCSAFLNAAMNTIKATESIKTVILSARFNDILDDRMQHELTEAVQSLTSAGREVVIVGPTPTIGVDFGKCFIRVQNSEGYSACNYDRSLIPDDYFKIMSRLEDIARSLDASLIDLADYLCGPITCNAVVGDIFVYRDTGHLSREGSRLVFDMINKRRAFAGSKQ